MASSAKQSIKKTKLKKKKEKHPIIAEIRSFGLLIITLVILSCLLFSTGKVGGFIRNVFFGMLGPVGALTLPLFISLILFFGRRLRANRVIRAKVFFAFMTVIPLTGALHLLIIGVPDNAVFFKFIGTLWTQGKTELGGGLIGGTLGWLTAKLSGRYLAAVLLIVISSVSFTFAVGSTVWGLWVFIADVLGISPTKRREKQGKNKAESKTPSVITMEEISQLRAASISSDVIPPVTSSHTAELYGDTEPTSFTASSELRAATASSDIFPKEERDEPNADFTVTEPPRYSAVATASALYEPSRAEASVIEHEPDTEVADIAEDYEEIDDIDGDPFADQPEKKERLMDKLFRRDSKMKELIREDTPAVVATASSVAPSSVFGRAQKPTQPEPPQDDGVKRWTPGDKYAFPSTELLNPIAAKKNISEEEVNAVADKILRKLASFKVSASLVGYSVGPSITRYELAPGEGVRVSKISQLITDLSLELASEGVRIEAPIPGKAAVGIEVPNKKVSIVSFRSLVENAEFMKAKSKITVCVGQNVTGDAVFMDIDDMPHVLIAGQTKSGKSVAINCMLLSLLYRVTPDEVKLILVDPKRVELNIYGRLPHLIAPVVDEPTKAAAVLSWAVKEMERRYDLMGKYSARNRDEYRKRIAGKSDAEDFPQIIIVIDELADLMLQVREHVEPLINRLAAKARACGIHLLIGTQRPSVDVLTGLIKANIPARISFKVAEQVDSRTIIGSAGAEKLLGRGDMLYQPTGSARVRIQGAYVDGEEINRVVDYIVENNGEATYDPDIIAQIDEEAKNLLPTKKRGGAVDDDEPFDREKKLDPLFYNAVEIAVQNQSVSTSSLQRYLEVGYGRAAKLIDTMEKMGIAGPPNGSKPRAIFMDMDQYQVWRLEQRFD